MSLDLAENQTVQFETFTTGQRAMWIKGRGEDTILIFNPSDDYNEY